MKSPVRREPLFPLRPAIVAAAALLASTGTFAQAFLPGDLIVSGSTYQNVGQAASITSGSALPYGGVAVAGGSNLSVFNNETPDPAFGVTSAIFLQQLHGSTVDRTVNIDPTQVMNSFSSKSELAINVSPDGKSLTFMGYAGTAQGGSALGSLDISNANTSAVVDPTNTVTAINARAIGTVNLSTGALSVTPVNAYSGNNGRAAVLVNGTYYMVGNAGNSSKSVSNATLNALSANTGVQSIAQGSSGNTTVIGAPSPINVVNGKQVGGQYGFDTQQVGLPQDKTGKDDNFRGMTVFNNTLYVTKGSGSNGVNTVYQVGAAGALANGGQIPTDATITVLPGFSTTSAGAKAGVQHPFGLWFENATTLFVADEGDAKLADAAKSMTDATAPGGGLAEYTLVGGTWQLAQTFQNGLDLGVSCTVTAPDGSSVTPATDGLRNITGKVNADGSVTIYATTSTVNSGLADEGAAPNRVVGITIDSAHPSDATFTTVESAAYGQVFRGVALAPVPEPEAYALMLLGLGAVSLKIGRRARQ